MYIMVWTRPSGGRRRWSGKGRGSSILAGSQLVQAPDSFLSQEELDRVIPVVEAMARQLPVPVSVDTSKAEVMREALRAGAGMINDVRALREPGALEALIQGRCYGMPHAYAGRPRDYAK